jgi:RimJ/RimL family protein N-acetyltransferase
MASTSNPYSSEPAFPILAHSLLPQSCQPPEITSVPRLQNHGLESWNLKDDVLKAFESPTEGVFRCGSVIGFSKLRNQNKEDDDNELIGWVITLLSFLLGFCPSLKFVHSFPQQKLV